MKKIKFEYRVTIIYLIVGCIWILFSDKAVGAIATEPSIITQIQTYKGWFYVSVTGILLFFYLKNHLTTLRSSEKDLEVHKRKLERAVGNKMMDLDEAMEEINATNEELYHKNMLVNTQNDDLKIALKDLQEAQSNLVQSEKMASLGVLTAGVAHEINNPLNFINGGYLGLKMYFENPEENKEIVKPLLDSIKLGVDRATNIVKGLNQFSRESSSNSEFCNINEIINNCVLMLGSIIKSNISITKDFTEEPCEILGNVGKMHQVFINLISNAVQAIEGKGEIRLSTSVINQHLKVEISDTGIGIKKEDLNKVTDPFYTTKAPGKGTGLGLSITYHIINDHRGKLEFDSEYEKGTTVTLTFPTKAYSDQITSNPAYKQKH